MDNAYQQRQFVSDCGRYINSAKASFGKKEYRKPVLATAETGFFMPGAYTQPGHITGAR